MMMAPEIFPVMMIPENVLVELTLSETNVHSVLPVSLDFQIAKVNKVNSYCNILRSSIHDQTYVKKYLKLQNLSKFLKKSWKGLFVHCVRAAMDTSILQTFF